MTKNIYLTIDDGPSSTTPEKVDWLVGHGVPAIFFFIGSHMISHSHEADYAIERGFWVGNHAYSHRRFSLLQPDVWQAEIATTESLIDAAHRRSSTTRTTKLFRFPFGDKGGAHREEIQKLLRREGFRQPRFRGVTYPTYRTHGYHTDADTYWTVESYEYKVATAAANIELMRAYHPRTGGSIDDTASYDILLIHDHASTTAVFFEILETLLRRGVHFCLPI